MGVTDGLFTNYLPINQIGLGNVTEQLGVNNFMRFISGETGFDESVRQYNTSLDWEKEKFEREIELANTAHQREMEDLKAAGLNPIMFGNKGAQTPSVGGVSPMNLNNAGQGLRDLVFSGISSALDLENQKKQNELIAQQITNLKTDNAYKQFRQMVEEFENMDWEMPDGTKVNKAQLTMAFLYNTLIEQEQGIQANEYMLNMNEKYGDWREIMNLIRNGTGSFKDIAGSIADLIRATKTTIPMDTETINTEFDDLGNERIKNKRYKHTYRNK